MHSTVRAVALAAASAIVLVGASPARANSGTQLPLSQFQAGTEQTNNALITNPGFEQPGVSGPNATGWTNTGAMSVGAPTPGATNPPSVLGSFSAKAGNLDINNNEMYAQSFTLAPNTDYVMSAYIWNFALAGPNPPNDFFAGDLAVVQLRDDTNFFNTSGVILERTGLDSGDGANGYFVYKSFNSSQFPGSVTLEVLSDPNESLGGARPAVMAQWDNIAITPLADFIAQAWTGTGGGDWGNNANWLNNQPNAYDAIATLGDSITGAATITLDAPKTVAVINFDSPHAYTIAGSNTLTLHHEEDRDSVLLNVFQGSHTIQTPITVVQPSNSGLMNIGPKNLKVDVVTGGNLAITNDVVSSGTALFNVHKSGGGKLDMKNVRADRLIINEGTVRVLSNGTSAGTSTVKQLIMAGGTTPTATLDLTNNALVVDYTPPAGPEAEPFDTIRAQIVSAYNGGAWTGNGITSSLANASVFGLGYAEASALATVPAIFGTVDSDAVLVRFTRYGDADLSGTVNLSDFNALASSFGLSGRFWHQGDFNYDGTVNLSDFNLLAGNFGLSAGPDGPTAQDWATLATAVPEPSALLLFGVPALAGMRRRQRD